MIAGTDDVMGFEFDDIGFLSIEANLMAPLVEPAAALHHRVMAIGRLVVNAVVVVKSAGRLVAHSLLEKDRPIPVRLKVLAI